MSRLLILAPDLSRNAVYPPWQFAGAMRQGGHEVTLAGTRSGALWPPLEGELATATELPGRWAGLPGAADAVAAAGDAQAVYAFKAMPTSLGVALRIRAAKGVPVLVHLDDWDAGFFQGVGAVRRTWYGLRSWADPNGDLWLRLMDVQVSRSDAVTVSTRALQRRYGGVVVRQGLDTERYGPHAYPREEARRRIGAVEDRPLVLFLGTPRLHKGLGHLEALAGEDLDIWFIGADAKGLAEAGVPSGLLEGAHIRGPVPFEEAAWYLAACDVFVVPQTRTVFSEHQLPAKLVQAMAMGCAIVTSDLADAGELLGGNEPAGLLAPADDPVALTEAVLVLLRDPDLRRRLGSEARARAAAELGWASMRSRVENVLAEVGVHG